VRSPSRSPLRPAPSASSNREPSRPHLVPPPTFFPAGRGGLCFRAESQRLARPSPSAGSAKPRAGVGHHNRRGQTDNGGSRATALHVARRRVLARRLRLRRAPPASPGAVPRRRRRRHVRPAPRPPPHRGAAPRVGAPW
jgi:hypothetical protein